MTKEELKKESEEYLKQKLEERKDKFVFELPEVYIEDVKEAYLASAEPREKRIAELEAQIEKMKCCGNCRFSESDKLNGTFCHREGCFVVASAKCKLWEN